MPNNQTKSIVITIVIGAILAVAILSSGNTPTASDQKENKQVGDASPAKPAAGSGPQAAPDKGPRGGKLFTKDGFGVEVTIFEKDIPPQFRIYLYENGKPVPPDSARVSITLSRLGAPAELFLLKPENEYLASEQTVGEPHSFDMLVKADRHGKSTDWRYSQIEGRIEMNDETVKSVGVELRTAGPATISPELKLPGEIIFNEHTIVRVVPRVPGMVTTVERHHGQEVRKGDILAIIESSVLADLRGQYMVAKKRLGLAHTTFEREKQLWEEKITAKQDFLTAQAASSEAEIAFDLAGAKLRMLGVPPEPGYSEKNMARYEIRAPISGLITEKAIALGETLKEDSHIYTIADISTVWAAITVYPKNLGDVRVGQKAVIKAAASNIEGTGTISYITTLIGGQTRTATIRIELDNKNEKWRPGMFVNAALTVAEMEVPVAVSADAIQIMRDSPVVFGRYDNYFEIRPLELGRSDGRMVEVVRGLPAGNRYAAGNSFAIKAELGKATASHDH